MAVEEFKKAIDESNNVDLYIGLSFASAMLCDFNLAFEASAIALESSELSYKYLTTDEIDLIIKNYQNLIILTPFKSELHFALATLYFINGSYNEAAERFKNCVIIKPDCFEYQFFFAQALFYSEKYSEAALIYQKSILLDFESVEAHEGLYRCYVELKNIPLAENELIIIEKIDRDYYKQTIKQ
jgi:tetratricopeptide (TPR) repeat protein